MDIFPPHLQRTFVKKTIATRRLMLGWLSQAKSPHLVSLQFISTHFLNSKYLSYLISSTYVRERIAYDESKNTI